MEFSGTQTIAAPIGVTVFFRENPTLRDGMASQAALSTHDEERGNQGNAFCMHLLLLK
jgi:hypothetical protein